MTRSPQNVVAVSNDALRASLLDLLLEYDSKYGVVFVEPLATAYSRIREVQPDAVVLLMDVRDLEACQLLSMLELDPGLRGVRVATCATRPEPPAEPGPFDVRADLSPRAVMAN